MTPSMLFENLGTTITAVGSLLTTVLVGAICVPHVPHRGNTLKDLGFVTSTIFIPCMLFHHLATAFTPEAMMTSFMLPLATLLGTFIGFVVGYIFCNFYLDESTKQYRALALMFCTFQNAVVLPLSLIMSVFRSERIPWLDDAAYENCVAYVFIYTVPVIAMIWSVGNLIAKQGAAKLRAQEAEHKARDAAINSGGDVAAEYLANRLNLIKENGDSSGAFDIRIFGLNLLKSMWNPPFISTLMGLAMGLNPWLVEDFQRHFDVVWDSMKLLGEGTVPCVLIMLGGNLGSSALPAEEKDTKKEVEMISSRAGSRAGSGAGSVVSTSDFRTDVAVEQDLLDNEGDDPQTNNHGGGDGVIPSSTSDDDESQSGKRNRRRIGGRRADANVEVERGHQVQPAGAVVGSTGELPPLRPALGGLKKTPKASTGPPSGHVLFRVESNLSNSSTDCEVTNSSMVSASFIDSADLGPTPQVKRENQLRKHVTSLATGSSQQTFHHLPTTFTETSTADVKIENANVLVTTSVVFTAGLVGRFIRHTRILFDPCGIPLKILLVIPLVRLIIVPVVAISVFHFLLRPVGLLPEPSENKAMWFVLLTEATAPSAVNINVLCTIHTYMPGTASKMIFYQYSMSVVTMVVWLMFTLWYIG